MTEGYLLLATGPACYAEMARNLAASIRVMDPGRRICLVHDEAYRADAADLLLFDDRSLLRDDPLYPGFMNKVRLHGVSPYTRTMFVDADCLLVKTDIDTYWDAAAHTPFGITGARQTRGEWKGADVARLLEQEGAPYLVRMNSGVFCFDDSPASAAFFQGLNDFYLRRHHVLGIGLHRGQPAQTDEIYIGLWLGMNGMDACVADAGRDRWMISTWRAFGVRVEPVMGECVLRKPKRSFAGVPNPAAGWDRLSPSLLHFIGLKPQRTYDSLSAFYMQAAIGSSRSSVRPDLGRRMGFPRVRPMGARTGRSPLHNSGSAPPARSQAV